MPRRPTIRFSSSQYDTYGDLDEFRFLQTFIGIQIIYKVSTMCLCTCILSNATVLCVSHCWLGAFCIPATAGVELRVNSTSAQRTAEDQNTSTTPHRTRGVVKRYVITSTRYSKHKKSGSSRSFCALFDFLLTLYYFNNRCQPHPCCMPHTPSHSPYLGPSHLVT
jgi:hypothetical protein